LWGNERAAFAHVRATHPVLHAVKPTPRRSHRSTTLGKKHRFVLRMEQLLAQGVRTPLSIAVKEFRVPRSTASTWWKAKDSIKLLHRSKKYRKKKFVRAWSGKFPLAEDLLYEKFCFRRKYMGLPTPETWLKMEFAIILSTLQCPAWRTARQSNGWVTRFKKRYGITSQCATNKHVTPVETRLPAIRKFHRALARMRSSGTRTDSKYGRFRPTNMFHMDQIPISFVQGGKRTLNMKGTRCWIVSAGSSGLEKRQMTLQLTVGADGSVHAAIIFRGQGLRLSQAERDQYPDSVSVYWQANAWADEPTMNDWLLDWIEELIADGRGGEYLLGMDHHGAQQTLKFRKKMKALNTVPFYTPPHCTDCVSVVDHNIGGFIKSQLRKYFQRDFATNYDAWVYNTATALTASARRVWMAKWIAEACEALRQRADTLIIPAFVHCGWLLAADGSEDNKIQLQGWHDEWGTYSFSGETESDDAEADFVDNSNISSDELESVKKVADFNSESE
jgi:hypothetical protein